MMTHFLSSFDRLQQERRGEPAWLKGLRQASMDTFAQVGFPTPRDEEWKYTNVAPLTQVAFVNAAEDELSPATMQLATQAIADHRLDGCALVVLIDGRYAPQLSAIGQLPGGADVRSLAEALAETGDLSGAIEAQLGRHTGCEQGFCALNTALMRDGVVVRLSPETVVERPIQIVYLTSGRPGLAVFPRNMIIAERSSQLAVIETYATLDGRVSGDASLTAAVTEVVAGAGATVEHTKIQLEASSAFHIATVQAHQARDSHFRSRSISLGGKLARNDINSRLDDEGCRCTLDGLYVVDDDQHVDHHTMVDHAKPHCSSHELYKGILGGRSRGVFNGKIFVRPQAQKTDAVQNNKNLLLSDDATINTKPQLEIFADDVRCTHGATVGQLDEDALFYLRSRGVAAEQARNLLIYAFAREIVDSIGHEALRLHLDHLVSARLPRAA